MEQKKESRRQIERRIKNAVVFVPKDKDTLTAFFSDKGVRLTVTSDSAVIETNYHRHVFSNYTASGESRPYIYTRRIVELANEHQCTSFKELLEKTKDNQDTNNIVVFFSWWLLNIFQPLYSIGESQVEAFVVYATYARNVATNVAILDEKKEDVTCSQFLESINKRTSEILDKIPDAVLFKKKTDEEIMQENIDAIKEQETEDFLQENLSIEENDKNETTTGESQEA